MEKKMDALERRFAETHDPEAKKQLKTSAVIELNDASVRLSRR
jgi:hypothetical protein